MKIEFEIPDPPSPLETAHQTRLAFGRGIARLKQWWRKPRSKTKESEIRAPVTARLRNADDQ